MAEQLIALRSLDLDAGDFNWVFLIWYFVSAVFTIFFLFYFDRLFASLIIYGIRAYLWHYYRAYVSVQALQVSLLAGRLFFKSARYHAQNETIIVHDGYITWRYWLRHVQELDWQRPQGAKQNANKGGRSSDDDDVTDTEKGVEASGERKPRHLPCRILLKARGVEWYVYNRSPAYDALFRSTRDGETSQRAHSSSVPLQRAVPNDQNDDNASKTGRGNYQNNHMSEDEKYDNHLDDGKSNSLSGHSSTLDLQADYASLPKLINMLPIGVECSKGAVVMGNRNTRSILTVKFESAIGKIDATQSRPLDQYKQIFDFDFVHPIVEFKHNKDYTEPQAKEGAKLRSHSDTSLDTGPKPRWFEHLEYADRIRQILNSLCDFVPYRRGSVGSTSHPHPKSGKARNLTEDGSGAYGQSRWLGLSRYLDDDDDLVEQERWKAVEYGQFSTILDSPRISMNFFWDVPGVVSTSTANSQNTSPVFAMDINGDSPPEWGIELKIGGGTIHYGPWADRQRLDLQAAFFPTLYKDASPSVKLVPGQRRVSTILNIVVVIEDQTILRVPTREESKDWKWRGHKFPLSTPDVNKKMKHHGKLAKKKKLAQPSEARPPGWFDVKLSSDSTISFSMDLVARNTGYQNQVNLDLKGLEISSSVNHGLLGRSISQTISCNLCNPLAWNALRKWHVDICDNSLELFILRDHVFLLTDLVNDWTSGPSGDFFTFIPFEYSINMQLQDFKLYLNANDSNIINDPADFEDNTFVIVWGKDLNADIVIPSNTFRPARSLVRFEADASDGGFRLHTPPRNTQNTFLESSDVASLKDLRFKGSYNYFTTTSSHLTDILLMDIYGLAPTIDLYGFMIRYFMIIKDNYFGDDIHFRTLEEYQAQLHTETDHGSEDALSTPHARNSNDLDVILGIRAENLCVLLPANLYSAGKNIRLEILSVKGDLRITNYYMDLAVSSSPVSISHMSFAEKHTDNVEGCSNTQMYVDGLNVFGHRLFGLPPTEPTYVCNWDFDVGSVTGECEIDFIRSLIMALKCFSLTFDDDENALPPLHPAMIHDITFLRARLESVSLSLRVEQAGFLLNTGRIEIDLNDMAERFFSDRAHVLIPDLNLAVADAPGLPVDRLNPHYRANTHAWLQTSVEFHGISRKQNFDADRQLQQSHIELHDMRTHRIPWLIYNHDRARHDLSGAASPIKKAKTPAMPFPIMPEPIFATHLFAIDEMSLTSASAESGSSTSMSSRSSSFLLEPSSVLNRSRTQSIRKSYQRHQKGDEVRSKSLDTVHGKVSRASIFDMSTESALGEKTPDRHARSFPSFAQSNLSFSSPYKKPHFPLLTAKLDVSELPSLPEQLTSEDLASDFDTSQSLKAQMSDEDTERSNYIVSLSQGVRGFCTPEALYLMTDLLATLQATDTMNLLDNLQIDTIIDVSQTRKLPRKGNHISDLRVFVPSVAMRFVNTTRIESLGSTRRDRYDLTLDNLTITASQSRNVSGPSAAILSSQYSIHLAVDQIECSARESVEDKANDQAVIGLSVISPVIWILYGSAAAADVQFEKLEIVSASRKVDYISSLIRQTLVLSEELIARFTKLERERKDRLGLLVLSIALEGANVPDPPFLTRLSHLLRSTPNHIRTWTSWRIMSRLRYIYRCLPELSRERINSRCVQILPSCPPTAADSVISSFDQGQTWDVAQVKSSVFMRKVYDTIPNPVPPEPNVPLPLKAALKAGLIQFLVEPGSKQNKISFKGMVVGLAVNQSRPSGDSPLEEPASIPVSTIQVHCVETTLQLNWNLLEVLENVLETVWGTNNQHLQNSRLPQRSPALLNNCRLHVVISSELNVLNCDTPNVKIESLCQKVRVSIITSEDNSLARGLSMSLLLTAEGASSEIKTCSTKLTSYKLRNSKIFGIQQENPDRDHDKPWKFVGTGEDVLFEVLANPLQLIEAADCFLEYEVVHLLDWTKSLQSAQSSTPTLVKRPKKSSLPRVQVALFLGSYLIGLDILPSLSYQISGTRASSSFKLGQLGDHDSKIDFSLNNHSHTFKARQHYDEDWKNLSILQMPPIMGRLLLDLAPEEASIDFSGLAESIVFDASAVHAIFTAINRPEIMSFGASVKSELSALQSHYEKLSNTVGKDQNLRSSKPTLYKGNVSLASLVIHTGTSESLSVAKGAELRFKMNRVQLKATNRESGSRAAVMFPELEVKFNSICLDLLRFDKRELLPCGNVAIKALLRSTSKENDSGRLVRFHQLQSSSLRINVYSETPPVIVAILVHLQETLRTIDVSHEVQNLRKLRGTRLRSEVSHWQAAKNGSQDENKATALFNAMYSLEMTNICITWKIENSTSISPGREPENLILSFTKIDLATKKENAARLLIENLQLQMVPASKGSTERSLNSALLPEVVFNVAYVSTSQDRRFAFQVAGKSLDLQLTSQFILPASDLRRSIALSIQQVRTATADWNANASMANGQTKRLLGSKRLASLLVDADFAGAVVYIQGRSVKDPHSLALDVLRGGRLPQHGRYNQFTPENATNSSTTLRSPGIAFKVEYKNARHEGQSLNAEMKVNASSNVLYPTVVPLVMELSSTIKDIVGEPTERAKSTKPSLPQPKFLENERLRGADPAAIFGNCKLNLGLRICKQEFSLSCQPIARVAATARFEDIYITVNTVQSQEHGKFFTVAGAFTGLQASVQHVYSRESTGSFEVDSIVISMMNSKHISTANGISAIVNVSPMKAQINGKQSQDFLLFREIWIPPEIRRSTPTAAPAPASESQAFIVQRYQQIAAAGAFPWNARISIAELSIEVDLGQSLGKSAFIISKLWISSRKTSDWEQNLCLQFDRMAVDSTGRMSGFVELHDLKMGTSIQWPVVEKSHNQTPLVQASLAFDHLRIKAAFDFQAFAIADITAFQCLMYNVRDPQHTGRDRLVGVLDGDKVQIFCTTTSASQIIALSQAFQRLHQEKVAAYKASLRELEKFLRRKSSITASVIPASMARQEEQIVNAIRPSLKLQTDVVITLKAVNVGAFPSTFFDNQIFKLEALDASARFTVVLDDQRIHSTLGMNLGQLRIALAGIARTSLTTTLGEISVADVVDAATGSRGGTILKVPKLVATMETWQNPESSNIEYIFKSSFQGKVDVGWNYSRISYIRGMWTSHARALAQRLGKPLPQSAVRITGGPRPEGDEGSETYTEGEQGKITAVVNVPQSKYQYTALQPPIIETPQLRDMGEATPPLEWIGLHRERLPNLTHQIVIVTLLEVAREVDDAYSKILGNS